ncbi:DUF6691 family protein [Reinekea sp.]|jgi:uncharacterized membrane protein YedE/YeeE|uniref:DUF6691 family protein n=1 Tax=Reinekea sp. TaxID=1970455 RepID=UPI0039895298
MKSIISLLTGILFGAGLCVSGMVNPAKVINFLDISGQWDPSLGLVMLGGLTIMIIANLIGRKMNRPLYAEYWRLPTREKLDSQLLIGSGIFGIGWGIGGFCPGPALTAIAYSNSTLLLGVAAYLVGVTMASLIRSSMQRKAQSKMSHGY